MGIEKISMAIAGQETRGRRQAGWKTERVVDEVRSGSRIHREKRLVKLWKLCRYGEEEPETSALDR